MLGSKNRPLRSRIYPIRARVVRKKMCEDDELMASVPLGPKRKNTKINMELHLHLIKGETRPYQYLCIHAENCADD
jgi:hypothetical protein